METKLSKNILSNKNILLSKSISEIINVFGSRETEILFDKNLKSIKLPEYDFTNFLKSTDKTYIKFIKKEIKRIESGSIDILEEYHDKPIGFKKNDKLKIKVQSIYNKTYNKYESIPFIKRLTKIGNEKFQLYYKMLKDGTFLIILVDVYHLIIPAIDKGHHETQKDTHNKFLEYVGNNYDIANFFIS